jgi:hypothetical protein
VVEYGDGWMPNRPSDFGEILPRLRELQSRAQSAGRGPLPVTMSEAPMDPAEIETYPALGVERCVYWLPSTNEGELVPLMDEIASFADRFVDL